MDRRQESPFGVGIITIITVLLVLTLSIFAALTLTTAKADLALSEINAETVQSYYAAFASGEKTELDEWIPMEGNRSLHIALGRIPSGAVEGGVAIEHWEVVAGGPDESEIQDQWNLWDGGLGE